MISWERRHNNTETELIVKYDGGGGILGACCLLLETGAPNEVLLESGGDCIAPEDC